MAGMSDNPEALHGFPRDDLEAIADALDSGYDKTVNVGNTTGEGDEHVPSTTAVAARFIRAALAQQAATPAPAEPVAHMYPSDLERFQTSETFATAYSVAVGCPDERSVPLYAAPPATPAPAEPPLRRTTGWAAPEDRYVPPVLFNPYTGEPRDVRDVQSDPQGVLIHPPGAAMLAAPPATPAAQPKGPA